MNHSNYFSKHHIGGRNGRGGFPEVPMLHSSIASTMYEADASCLSQIESEQLSQGFGLVSVIPACLAGSNEMRSFNINLDGYTSSLLQPNPKYQVFYYQQSNGVDYSYDCVLTPVQKLDISTVTLDSIHHKTPVDFLSLDTQGSELEILYGSAETLKNSVGIETEVSFRQIYKDSPLFGDISSFLVGQGFEFIGFTSLTFDAPRTISRMGRYKKLLSFADALFLRVPDPNMEESQKRKLVFASLVYGQIEYASYCVKELNLKSLHKNKEEFLVQTWGDFVDKFIDIAMEEPPDTLKFSDIHGFNIPKTTTTMEMLRVYFSQGEVKKGIAVFKNKLFTKLLKTFSTVVTRLPSKQSSQLELLFQGVGLSDIANDLKFSRLNTKVPYSYMRL